MVTADPRVSTLDQQDDIFVNLPSDSVNAEFQNHLLIWKISTSRSPISAAPERPILLDPVNTRRWRLLPDRPWRAEFRPLPEILKPGFAQETETGSAAPTMLRTTPLLLQPLESTE
jgi:hypothetical protein